MTVIKADPNLKAYLEGFTEVTEIQDTEGRVLGVYTPRNQGSVDYSEVRKLIDPEEIRRRKERSRNDPGRPLEEIVKRLQSLENSQ